ncbi:MAG: PilZ domain-containing protein [Acidobacteriota bacterium]
MEKEKRKEKRKQEEQQVELEVYKNTSLQKQTDSEKFSAVTENLSLNGVKIKTSKYYPVNTVLKIKLPLLRKRHVSLRGKVRWVRNIKEEKKFGMGIEFLDTLPAEFIALMEHLYGAFKSS